jgi:diaminohydroxyphosphoribosylaminopyrimidine deaminase/5-amino-6-(5-phosphoribosylamino)uracil reductase
LAPIVTGLSMNRILPHIKGAHVSPLQGPSVDDFHLDRAIDLAWLGAGRTLSNPMVGAVVVKDGCVVGEGYHAAFGLDHAETVALDRAGDRADGATLYVNLEPCTHHGKTPPCVGQILESGVQRVVVSTLDPDPRMDGKGIEALRAQGIQVDVGGRAEHALLLNLPYFKRSLGQGCSVTVKMAVTWDGRIASGPGRRDTITGPEARRHTHRLRAANEGVLIGINTMLVDRPLLDCRLLEDVDGPAPVVMDTRLRFPLDCRWMAQGRRFVVLTARDANAAKARAIEEKGGVVLACRQGDDRVEVSSAIETIDRWGISSVLVEGGAGVLTSFLRAGMWDGLHLFVSAALFGPQGVDLVAQRVDLGDAVLANARTFSQDVLVSYLNATTRAAMLARVL